MAELIKTWITKSYKLWEVVKSLDRLYIKGTLHLKEEEDQCTSREAILFTEKPFLFTEKPFLFPKMILQVSGIKCI